MDIHGRPALILIDIQKGETVPEQAGIPVMPGAAERHARARTLLAAARAAGAPPVFVQEVHKPTLVDFGRELDGAEAVHCLEGDPLTELADGLEPQADEYLIRKRRYSAFFATELLLVLRSLRIETVVLIGTLTDVCVHLTFADAHQHDFHCRVVTDCVGGSTAAAHDGALATMRYLQRDCLVTTEEACDAFANVSVQATGVAA